MREPDNEDQPHDPYNWDHLRDNPDIWDQLRSNLVLGQRLTGTVAQIPRLGTIGIFIDLGLPVAGFVDVLLLPDGASRWPTQGTTADFLIWWMDERPQIRLVPADARYRREDFDTWCLTNAPTGDARILEHFRFDPSGAAAD
ncbi:hypothetical protein ACFQZZ_00265 [Nocardia sp. GCM10030253]|uniref:hypothetical protein n=1 Tax=Nocardia sp. GCM10030253 TaxID=3273404 RepID=UPI003632087B